MCMMETGGGGTVRVRGGADMGRTMVVAAEPTTEKFGSSHLGTLISANTCLR